MGVVSLEDSSTACLVLVVALGVFLLFGTGVLNVINTLSRAQVSVYVWLQ